MPINNALATQIWNRYTWCRDNGHTKFVQKADLCEAYFRGDQWSEEDKAKLAAQRRPALTINKILPTVSNVMGEQIYNRAETGFRPRSGAPEETATVLTKVFKQISDNNQLDWKRSDVFSDGVITSRGFLDVRIDFNDSMQGEVRIDKLNPKNVIPDPDADEYDPDTWGDVFTTKWVTADDIAILYNREDAEYLRNRDASYFPYGYDSIQFNRDRFGETHAAMYQGVYDESSVMRSIRLIDRQYRKLDKQKFFVAPETGDMRQIPENFDRDRIAFFVEKLGLQVTTKLVRRIRWTVIADSVVLHDDWSPYKHFTVVPFFPHLRHGKTVGIVENLISSQELLNKVSSQELHVINTTANSGWKVKAGTLTNMSIQELEQRGAETGLVVETSGNPDEDLVRITPNSVPTGLDRISYKAEDHIKTISGVSDSMQGFDREDVAAKAIQAKRQAGSTNLVKPMDNLTRTDHILARNVLDLVQQFYTEPRLMTITKDRVTGETETFGINQPTPEGEVLNNLTLGEYDVVITSVPQRETLEDSQFEQAMALKEAGVQIPDEILITSSRLLDKRQVIEKINAGKNSPEVQQQQQLALRGQAAEVSKTEAEVQQKSADAQLKLAKAQKEGQPEPEQQGDGGAALMKTAADIDLNERKFAHQQQVDFAKLAMEREKQREESFREVQRMEMEQEQARTEAAVAAAKPTTTAN